jgi:curved DNA-binding protein CbpA
MENPYDILELPRNATIDEVKKKYRELALSYHPDKLYNIQDINEKNIRIEKFKKITVAYDMIYNKKDFENFDYFKYDFDNFNYGNYNNFGDLFTPNEWKEVWNNIFNETNTKDIIKETFIDIATIFLNSNIKPKSYYNPTSSNNIIKHNINLPVSYKEVYNNVKRKLRLILNDVKEPVFIDIYCNSMPYIIRNYIDDDNIEHEIKINLVLSKPFTCYYKDDNDNIIDVVYNHIENDDNTIDFITDIKITLLDHILGVSKNLNFIDESIINISIEPFQNKIVKNMMGLNGGNLIINIIVKKLELFEWNKISLKDKDEMIRILNAVIK